MQLHMTKKHTSKIKLFFALMLILVITAAMLTGCGPKAETPAATEPIALEAPIRIAALKGPTGMGLVYLMGGPDEARPYEISLFGAPDEIVGKIVTGEVDLAAVPTNLAASLYNKTEGGVRYIATNTLGVLYVLTSNPEIDSFEDLKGKTIGISGQGSTAEFIFRHLLTENGIDPDKDVVLDFSLQHAELTALLTAGKVEVAVLPQPFVTTAMMNSEALSIAIDLSEAWADVHGADVVLPMGGLIARTEYLEAHPEALERFLTDYTASVEKVNADPKAASLLVEQFEILPKAAIAERAIPLSNIVYFSAADSKVFLTRFLEIMMAYDPKTVGGKVPDDVFFEPVK
jgi:NitT/TauT family transport system substrate-binding protein